MSGFEVTGLVLAAFPLIISGLEHWRDVAKVGGFYWRIRKEYTACRREVDFHMLMYKRNLKELLLPIMNTVEEVTDLVNDPGGKGWSNEALQDRLEARLQESYTLYIYIIREMYDVADALRSDLAFDEASVQDKLAPPEPKKQQRPSSPQPPSGMSITTSAKTEWTHEKFRMRFSFSEGVRKGYFDQLKECNARLEQLLNRGDKMSALVQSIRDNEKQILALENIFKQAWKKSDALFRALQNSWQCVCQRYHFANLRLEHRTSPNINFEIILMYWTSDESFGEPWSWKELQCASMSACAKSPKVAEWSITPPSSMAPPAPTGPRVTFSTPQPNISEIDIGGAESSSFDLCQALRNEGHSSCLGVIGDDDGTYHLHPSAKRAICKSDSTLR